MAGKGKFLGGIFGLILGGPLGMVAGIAFGHLFDAADEIDKSSRKEREQWDRTRSEWEQRYRNVYRRPSETGSTVEPEAEDIPKQKLKITRNQLAFFTGTFAMLHSLAAADGRISEREMNVIRHDIVEQRLKFNAQESRVAMKFFFAAEKNSATCEDYATQLYKTFKDAPAILCMMLQFLCQLRLVDGDPTMQKQVMIMQVAGIFHIPESQVALIERRYDPLLPAGERPYAVLEVSSSADQREVKKAYRRLSKSFHPDTLASQGVGPEFNKMMSIRFTEIEEAWNSIKDMRGWV